MHRLALASLHGEFATILRTDEVLAELEASGAPQGSLGHDAALASPSPVPTRGLHGYITHTELASDDPAATRVWCAPVLGWKFKPSFPTAGGEY